METIRLQACEVALDNHGILTFTPSESHNITGDDAADIINAHSTLSNRQTVPILIDHTIPHSLTFEAMQILSEGKFTSAAAFLFSTTINRKMIDYFENAGRPTYPIQSFTDRDQAIHWLSSYL